MTQTEQGACPICGNPAKLLQISDQQHYDSNKITCPRCGQYALANTDDVRNALSKLEAIQIRTYATDPTPPGRPSAYMFFETVSKIAYASKVKTDSSEARAVLSHALSKGPVVRILTYDDLTSVLTHTSLPTPAEQADNLLRYLGNKLVGFGDSFSGTKESDEIRNIGAIIGSRIGSEWNDFYSLIVAMAGQELLSINWAPTTSGGRKNFNNLSLSLTGWSKYEELDRRSRSKVAFIAMKFRAEDEANYYFQDILLPNYLVRAVKQTGFALSNPLADKPEAGNLHAKLELEIKKARFVIAELSHSNNGAYWEAGFAKGLGKPVIYMYNRTIGKRDTPHFDVGSDQVIFWEEEKPEKAAQALKDIIRNTLFGEADQNDSPSV